MPVDGRWDLTRCLTLNLLRTTIVALPSNASKWQMEFNSAFKGLKGLIHKLSHSSYTFRQYRVIFRESVVSTLLSYTSISKAAVGNV